MADERQFCTFKVDEFHFGVEVLQVQELIRFQEMTRVPLASDVIRGLINLRGQIVTAIDLRRKLGMPPLAGDHRPMNVVVRTGDGVVSLLVDEIGDVLNVSEDSFERPPETVSGVARELTSGVYKLKDRLLMILDTEKAANSTGVAA
ncbi:MAG TPA: chemotaxis protein CheW [Tepidisphaeraceae bacterium]|nr:chemotaxis protein CheW [Tepidisphaeraceae bacterium]